MPGVRFITARDLFDAYPTARADVGHPPNDDPSLDYLRSLTAAGDLGKAVSFCAYLLPRREAVWWARHCVAALVDDRTRVEEDLLKAADAWVQEPEEEQRRQALERGVEGDHRSPATWVALAAGWAGGNAVQSEYGAVPSPPHQTARAVRAAVLIGATRARPSERAERLRQCLEAGTKLATGEASA